MWISEQIKSHQHGVVDITSKELERAVTKKNIKLDKDAIKTLDISHLAEQSLNPNDQAFCKSEYRLYSWLSTV